MIERNEAKRINALASWLLFALSALAGALLFSPSTSPLYSDWGYDSAMFQTIGKYWAQGHLPYVELFDHKGPIIFFINALGYALGGRGGVFVIQVLCLAVSEYFAFRMLRMRLKPKWSLILTLALPLAFSATWQEGNTTEEYILPLLFASYYSMLLWLDGLGQGRYGHKASAAFLYGLSFAFALLTRVTNALGVCVGTAFIVVYLAVKGQWKNLFYNALAFIGGSAALILPFCLYFYRHGALYDMWYGTVIYNFSYMSSHKDALSFSLVEFLLYVRRCLCGFALVFAALWGLLFGRESKLSCLMWLLVSAASVAFLYGQNAYDHYATVLLPLFVLAVCELDGKRFKGAAAKLTGAVCVLMCVFVLTSSVYKSYKAFITEQPDHAYEYYGDEYHSLLALIPEEGRESFIAIDCPRRIYLENDLRPSFRFFTLQTWMGLNSQELQDMICEELEASSVQWLLMMDMAQERLPDIIREKYELTAVSEKGVYQLYKLK